MLIYNLENVKVNKLHDEFIHSNIIPIEVYSNGTSSTFKFSDTENTTDIQTIIDNHNPNASIVVCDSFGFIYHCCESVFHYDDLEHYHDSNYTSYTVEGVPEILIGKTFDIPTHRYLNDTISEVTNPNDYMVSMVLKRKYMEKRKTNFFEFLDNNTLSVVREYYHTLSSLEKGIFKRCYAEYWSKIAVNPTDITLSTEIVLRVLTKILYIKDVLKRDLTSTELEEYEDMLKLYYDFDALLEPDAPILTLSLPLLSDILDDISNTRLNYEYPNLDTILEPLEE